MKMKGSPFIAIKIAVLLYSDNKKNWIDIAKN